MIRPRGAVTFLFTDIEGSTRRWETEPEAMQDALGVHDDVLRAAVDLHGGWLFKHTGDGVCAAFASARAAIDAAVDAQRDLQLPVRMGIATGEAHERDGDYFGPALSRAARVMGAGHGGQVLVAASTASLVHGVELVDLGEHHLRDLAGATRLFQVKAAGLVVDFAPLRTVDVVPGNLPVEVSSFVGRAAEVVRLVDLMQAHRLVTLTGVGGVGKTRLAVHVAAEMVADFPDGVWLVELAPVADPDAVPDVVAAVLGVAPRPGVTMSTTIGEALTGRRLLVLLDNCEHVLDAVADLVESILAGAATVKVLATSRQGLGVRAEHLWPVPPLDMSAGVLSAAVELFAVRAEAVDPGFELGVGEAAAAVMAICRRLDGIALAIELAAARMVSMTAAEVLERLGDPFRLLSGSRRGLERHQTLRRAVQWSYDLLNEDERGVLGRCSVFADTFDLAAATHVCSVDEMDEYAMMDLLDSLVRKSLLTVAHLGDATRYAMLETIRQFAGEQLPSSTADEVRMRHARYFADRSLAYWHVWNGKQQRAALDWVDANFANLRAGFRWAADQGDVVTAAGIASHATMLAFVLQRYEPVGWAEETLEAATRADLRQLPRLYTAASFCCFTGRPEASLDYARAALAIENNPRYDPFDTGWPSVSEITAHLIAGRIDQGLEVAVQLARQPGLGHVVGLGMQTWALPVTGRSAEAITIADETVAAARAYGNPVWIAYALNGYGRAFADADPARALEALRQGLVFTRQHRLRFLEGLLARDAAEVQAIHGELEQALELFDATIELFHRDGNVANVAATLASLAVFFDRIERPRIAATVYGGGTHHEGVSMVAHIPGAVEHLHAVLGAAEFDRLVATGAQMELAETVQYARDQIHLVQRERATAT